MPSAISRLVTDQLSAGVSSLAALAALGKLPVHRVNLSLPSARNRSNKPFLRSLVFLLSNPASNFQKVPLIPATMFCLRTAQPAQVSRLLPVCCLAGPPWSLTLRFSWQSLARGVARSSACLSRSKVATRCKIPSCGLRGTCWIV